MKKYTEIIRELREDKDLKQSDLANVIGTTQQQYSKYETGDTELTVHALQALCKYYNVSADYLLGLTECKEGVEGLNKKVSQDYTIGALISNVLSLSGESRKAVIEYIQLQILKETEAKKKQ